MTTITTETTTDNDQAPVLILLIDGPEISGDNTIMAYYPVTDQGGADTVFKLFRDMGQAGQFPVRYLNLTLVDSSGQYHLLQEWRAAAAGEGEITTPPAKPETELLLLMEGAGVEAELLFTDESKAKAAFAALEALAKGGVIPPRSIRLERYAYPPELDKDDAVGGFSLVASWQAVEVDDNIV
jgi:hypothetical protein